MRNLVNWKVEFSDAKFWIWEDSRCRIWGTVDQVEKFLAENVQPTDSILFRGLKDKDIKIKGKQFLEEYNGSIKTLP